MALNTESIQKILRIAPLIMEMNLSNIQIDYDRDADVLYINFEPGREATDSEYLEEGIIIRYADNEIIGITIINASHLKTKST